MQLAYARMAGDGDAFGKYHPFDFDLGSAEITYDCEQIKITSAELNIVEFEVEGPDFSLKIGFNPQFNPFKHPCLLGEQKKSSTPQIQ